MLNSDKVDTIYLACGATDLRRNTDGSCWHEDIPRENYQL